MQWCWTQARLSCFRNKTSSTTERLNTLKWMMGKNQNC